VRTQNRQQNKRGNLAPITSGARADTLDPGAYGIAKAPYLFTGTYRIRLAWTL
jgi:hypothetical protein